MNPIVLTATPWQVRPVVRFNQGLYDPQHGWITQQLPAHWQQHPTLRRHAGKTVYRHRFSVPSSGGSAPKRRRWLRADGIFYWSRIYLNGRRFSRHEGYFAPQEHEITDVLSDDNTLIIEVDCPEERSKSGKRMLTGVFSHWDAIDPATNPGGIWLPVTIHESGAVRIKHLHLETDQIGDTSAQISWHTALDSIARLEVELHWRFTPANFDGVPFEVVERQEIGAGEQRLDGTIDLPDPQLWWTHDLGQPNLYTVTLAVHCLGSVSDTHSLRFGVRTFEFRDFIPYLNGTRFLIKGNNYPPTDTRIATVTADQVRHDLILARDCHMNLLRVHAHVGHPTLYDAADELGMLLWQDFPLQWTYRRTVLPQARQQAVAMQRLLGNHPSVVVWCMHNEPIFITDTADERIITGLRVYFSVFVWSWNRDVLDQRLARVMRRIDRSRPVISNSGEYAIPLWHRGNDTHFYFGWYIIYGRLHGFDGLPQRFQRNLRFVTEFGAQSFPNKASSLKFMAEDPQRINWRHLQRRHSFQGNVMHHWIDWRNSRSLDDLIERTQRYQSELNRFFIDRLRLRKYRPTGGIVPFLLVDSNPAIQWSIIDYWRVPKASYYAMRDAFRPHYAFTTIAKPRYTLGDQIVLPLYVVNDARQAMRYTVHVSVLDPEGRRVTTTQCAGELSADSVAIQIGQIEFAAARRGRYEVRIVLDDGSDRFTNSYQVRIGRRQQPRNMVQRVLQVFAASLAAVRSVIAMR